MQLIRLSVGIEESNDPLADRVQTLENEQRAADASCVG